MQLQPLPAEAPGLAPRLRVTGDGPPELRRHPYALDVTLAWDGLEVQRLLAAGGEARFAGYLAALPSKLRAWQEPRGIDSRAVAGRSADPDRRARFRSLSGTSANREGVG